MSVVVRMEMPQGCFCCPIQGFNSHGVSVCGIGRKSVDCIIGKPDWCPIVCQLPEGHGRLVDMRDIDSMMEDIQTTSDESGLYGLYYRDDFDFDGLPTIVPATEGEGK